MAWRRPTARQEASREGPLVSAADDVKTILATLATVAVLGLMMRALGRVFFTSLTSQIERKQEIIRRLSHRR